MNRYCTHIPLYWMCLSWALCAICRSLNPLGANRLVLRHFQGSTPRTMARDMAVADQPQHGRPQRPLRKKIRFCLLSRFLQAVTGFKSGRPRDALLSASPLPAKQNCFVQKFVNTCRVNILAGFMFENWLGLFINFAIDGYALVKCLVHFFKSSLHNLQSSLGVNLLKIVCH